MGPRLSASPPPLQPPYAHRDRRRALGVWLLSSGLATALSKYLAGRTTILSLMVVAPAPWIVLAVAPRGLAQLTRIPPLARLGRPFAGLARGSGLDMGWKTLGLGPLGFLMGLGSVLSAVSSGALRWEVGTCVFEVSARNPLGCNSTDHTLLAQALIPSTILSISPFFSHHSAPPILSSRVLSPVVSALAISNSVTSVVASTAFGALLLGFATIIVKSVIYTLVWRWWRTQGTSIRALLWQTAPVRERSK